MVIGDSFESIMEAAKLGQDWAWAAMYREIAGPVTGFLRARGVDNPEELAGDVFFELARSIEHFEGDEAAFRTFMFVIAYERLVDHRRALKRRPRSVLADEILDRLRSDTDADEIVTDDRAIEEVRRAFEVLTPEQRDVLSLRIIAGLTLDQTARVVGRGVGTVRSLQRKGLAKVRGLVASQGAML